MRNGQPRPARRVFDPSARLFLFVVLFIAVGANVGTVQSGNFIGAAVWSFVAVCVGAAIFVTRPG